MNTTPTRRRASVCGGIGVFSILAAACATASADRVDVPVADPAPAVENAATEAPFTPATTVATTSSTAPTTTATPTTSSPPLLVPNTTIASTPATTTPAATTTTPTTLPPPAFPPREPADPFFASTFRAFERLARANAGASVTVVSGGTVVYSTGSGATLDGSPATGDTPMVVASVSKLIVAVGVARLEAAGALDIAAPVPWADMGLLPNEAWGDVTVRELLDHRSGLSKARTSWFTGQGSCHEYVPSLLTSAPNSHRGTWVYSNGNYCLLGMLIEQRTGLPLDQALQQLVFDPIGAEGVHSTYGGLLPGDINYEPGVDRLSRLGGAGTLIASTDDIALLIGRLTPADLAVLQPPGVFTDQYGFGHTGTIDGSKACVWVFDGGTTVVSATIAGDSLSTGGQLCDMVVPAVATDLGINQGPPDRTP